MKKLKQVIAQIKDESPKSPAELIQLLWQFICYPPKMSLRLQQEQLLNEAEKFTLNIYDAFFSKKELQFNGFVWGNGSRKLIISHGWGSKAADFTDLIIALKEINDLQIISFDAPGNGSSEGDLSNLLLFAGAIKAVVAQFGSPDVVIGHSLGAMANIVALIEMNIKPSLLISIAPLIRLKENFEASMHSIGIEQQAQDDFFKSFEQLFKRPASFYNLNEWYPIGFNVKHWLAYDEHDLIAPYDYLKEFLIKNPSIGTKKYDNVGHDRIIKSPELIKDIIGLINS